ncbi:hypothetical protein C3V43_00560 [Bacteroides heparinolyticus]|nr:hypothetical protein C3V43_00560 [Bacteroides heparinolyticus]
MELFRITPKIVLVILLQFIPKKHSSIMGFRLILRKLSMKRRFGEYGVANIYFFKRAFGENGRGKSYPCQSTFWQGGRSVYD